MRKCLVKRTTYLNYKTSNTKIHNSVSDLNHYWRLLDRLFQEDKAYLSTFHRGHSVLSVCNPASLLPMTGHAVKTFTVQGVIKVVVVIMA